LSSKDASPADISVNIHESQAGVAGELEEAIEAMKENLRQMNDNFKDI
jgi:hypothetical protein